MENTLELLGKVKNPVTNKTLTEEKRWVSADVDEKGQLVITYKRDEIKAEDKRSIEDSIIEALRSYYESDKILVKTISKMVDAESCCSSSCSCSGGNKEKKGEKEKAALKVGHGVQGQKRPIANVDKVIAVSSCKGGVGKSTVSVNLALALASKGKKVGILDADIYGPSMPALLNKKGMKPEATKDKKIKPLEAFGMKCISFGLFINEEDPVIWRGPMLGGVLNQFFFDTDWGKLDYLIVDLPPGTGDVQLSLIQNTEVHGAVVVSTPQSLALSDTVKGLRMFQQVKVPILGMIENMSYFAPDDSDKTYYIFGKDGVKEVATSLEVPFLGGIPLEMEMRESSDEGLPYMANERNKERQGWKSYMAIAENMVKMIGDEKKGLFSKIFK